MNKPFSVSLRPLLLLVVLLLATALARAGQYVVTYTGGEVDNPDGTSSAFTNSGGASPSQGANWEAQNGVHAYGPITASLDWQGDDDPPDQVVVCETASMTDQDYYDAEDEGEGMDGGEDEPRDNPRASGLEYPDFTTGFDAETYTNYGYTHGTSGYNYINVAYQNYQIIQNPGRHIAGPFVCNLNFLCVTTVSGYDGSVNAAYSVTAQPLTIQLTGGSTKTPGNYLIGQRMNASISGVTGTTPTCQWSLSSGGSPFKSFGVQQLALTDTASQFTPLAASDYTNPTFGCSFAQTGALTINCAVHLAVPSGALPTGGLDAPLTASATITKPDLILPVRVFKGQVVLNQASSASADDARLFLGGNNGSGYMRPNGIDYQSEILTPSAFAPPDAQGNPNPDQGGFVWVQLVQLGTTRGLSDASTQTEVCSPPELGTWTFGLDTSYPYEPTSLADQHTVTEPSVGHMYIADGGGLDANGNGTVTAPCEAGDTPSEPLANQDSWMPQGLSALSYHVRQDFTVYQLYKAPGSDSQFVPVQSFHWYWGGDADHNTTVTLDADTANAVHRADDPEPEPAILAWILHNPLHDYDTVTPLASVVFPSWAHRQQASYFQYVASGH